MFTKKIALVSVINDLATDNRVKKTCFALQESGFEVVAVGRRSRRALPLDHWPCKAERMWLPLSSGPLFYVLFTLRLLLKLAFKKADLLYANDLDTLLPNYLVARWRGIPLIYDSHELFCDVPELLKTPLKRRIWQRLERYLVPRLRHCITVNESIARIFFERYNVTFTPVRNIPDTLPDFVPKTRSALHLPTDKKIVLLQGAGINIDRGAEELVLAMRNVEGAMLLIVGGGDCWHILQQMVRDHGLSQKVKLVERVPRVELQHYTCNADLGISFDKNSNPNYYNSLPNKLFDYLHAGVPVLASRLPEISKILETYQVGEFIDNHQPATIAAALNTLLNSERLATYKLNTVRVKAELNWDSEKQRLLAVIHQASGHKKNT